jgi:hypothetical protein
MPENNYREVRIIHPDTGGVATVPESSLAQHYLAGWTLLADDLAPDPVPAGPEPLTEAQVQADIKRRQDEFLAAEAAIAKHNDGDGQPPPDGSGDPNVPDPAPGGTTKDGSGDQAGKTAPGKPGAKAAGSRSGGSESN